MLHYSATGCTADLAATNAGGCKLVNNFNLRMNQWIIITFFVLACSGGNCNMKCSAETKCEQDCTDGNCKTMICEADTCEQFCTGGGCGLECHRNSCKQHCAGGNCNLQCRFASRKSM